MRYCISAVSILVSTRNSTRISTDSMNILVRPSFLHLVMCAEDSLLHPQHGQTLSMVGSIRDSCLLVPLKSETSFVTHTRNICGNAIMTLLTPFQ